MTRTPQPDTECTCFVRGKERYVFLYHLTGVHQVYVQLGRFAANPELSFTWFDAAVISNKIREYVRQQEAQQ